MADHLTPARRRLARRYWPSAQRIAASLARRYRVPIDWESMAAVGLCHAAARWEKGVGRAWSSWLYLHIRGACLDEIQRLRPLGYRTTADAPSVHSLGEESEGLEPLADELPVGWEIESEDAVLVMLAELPAHVQRVMHAACLDAGSLRSHEAGRRLGVDGGTVRRYRHLAISRWREAACG